MKIDFKLNRTAEKIKYIIVYILKYKIKDQRLKWISINKVDLSKDLLYAKVFFSSISIDHINKQQLNYTIKNASGFIKKQISISKVQLKNIPSLIFIYDASMEYSNKICSLLKSKK